MGIEGKYDNEVGTEDRSEEEKTKGLIEGKFVESVDGANDGAFEGFGDTPRH